jgi:hypothetical protein
MDPPAAPIEPPAAPIEPPAALIDEPSAEPIPVTSERALTERLERSNIAIVALQTMDVKRCLATIQITCGHVPGTVLSPAQLAIGTI